MSAMTRQAGSGCAFIWIPLETPTLAGPKDACKSARRGGGTLVGGPRRRSAPQLEEVADDDGPDGSEPAQPAVRRRAGDRHADRRPRPGRAPGPEHLPQRLRGRAGPGHAGRRWARGTVRDGTPRT